MTPKISVIIPIYNTVSYLQGCIDSVLNQSFKDFELILIDDGSTDGSSDICDTNAEADARVICIHQHNQGQQRAIQHGISVAVGDWLCFVDSDDQLTKNALEVLSSQANDSSDIIVGFSFSGNGLIDILPISSWRIKMFKGSEVLCTRWGKLYRRPLFNENSTSVSPSIRVGEDMIMNILLAFNTEKPVTILNQKVYCYNRNSTSVSATYHWTADRYHELFQALKSSIPISLEGTEEGTALRQAAISNAFSMVRSLLTFERYGNCRNLAESQLIASLRQEVQSSHYKMNCEERLIFYYPSRLFTHWLFVTKRFLLIVIQSIKRRVQLVLVGSKQDAKE